MMGPTGERSRCTRGLMYAAVSVLGMLVQWAVLVILFGHFHYPLLWATALAVEAAVLHNYFWHERWTWADRAGKSTLGRWQRLLAFHAANGLTSIIGNLVMMRVGVEMLQLRYWEANALAIACCSLINFISGDCLVFRKASQILEDRT